MFLIFDVLAGALIVTVFDRLCHILLVFFEIIISIV